MIFNRITPFVDIQYKSAPPRVLLPEYYILYISPSSEPVSQLRARLIH